MTKIKEYITLIFVTFLLMISTSQTSYCHFPSIIDNLEIIGDEIDGLYKGNGNVSGVPIIATLRIIEKKWTAISKIDLPGGGDSEYQRGIVVGVDLYDESGFIKIGYVSGDIAYLNGYPKMFKKTN